MKTRRTRKTKKGSEIKMLTMEMETCRERIEELKKKAAELRVQIDAEENKNIGWDLWECEDEMRIELGEAENRLRDLEEGLRR